MRNKPVSLVLVFLVNLFTLTGSLAYLGCADKLGTVIVASEGTAHAAKEVAKTLLMAKCSDAKLATATVQQRDACGMQTALAAQATTDVNVALTMLDAARTAAAMPDANANSTQHAIDVGNAALVTALCHLGDVFPGTELAKGMPPTDQCVVAK